MNSFIYKFVLRRIATILAILTVTLALIAAITDIQKSILLTQLEKLVSPIVSKLLTEVEKENVSSQK